ncbi:hypothetical protein [Rhodococcus sp. (in: high G+C Gram-positive bacteria)]|uniref:hypothetical protein n=1 Tax=Rhodococcus sp. TaxID=1831 RepID=UPI00257CD0BA|nr:hypothetical protein [Rhodococcus sp. (in: high G+C Gram-positive bacteria)]
MTTRSAHRRTRALVAAGAALLVAVTGCSSSQDTASDDAATASDTFLPEAEGTTTYPLTLHTPYGETVLEERPERIAIVGGLGELTNPGAGAARSPEPSAAVRRHVD